MHRFYLPPDQCAGPDLILIGPEAHHARHVLRVRPQECVVVLDGTGHEFRCEVEAFDGKAIRLKVNERIGHPPRLSQITLLQAVPKGHVMEDLIQKATELGVRRIVPIVTERVVARFSETEGARKAEKWRLVAREAIKQCGAAWLPNVEAPIGFADFLRREEDFELPLIASLEAGACPARAYFDAFQANQKRTPRSIAVWIGPEGDFTPAESKAVKAQGYLPITLGPLVLRVETAAIYCLSTINYELQSSAPTGASPAAT